MGKRGNKGWLKILEASLSMGMIMGFVVLVYSQGIERPNPGEAVLAWQGNILDELKDKVVLRDAVLNKGDTTCLVGGEVYNYTKEKVAKIFPGFGFECRVCGPGDICGAKYAPVERGEIYSEQRIISSTLQKFDPKKVKLFIFPLQKGETQENTIELRMNQTPECIPGRDIVCTDWQCVGSQWKKECTDSCTKAISTQYDYNMPNCPPTDAIPPASITNLVCINAYPIKCMWINPTTDFASSTIYLYSGKATKSLIKNFSVGTSQTYTFTSSEIPKPATGVSGLNYLIKVYTKDASNNENNTENIDNHRSCDIGTLSGGAVIVSCS